MDGAEFQHEPFEASGETEFAARWAAFARLHRLPDPAERPLAEVTVSVAELRRWGLEFASWGIVYGERQRQRVAELFPEVPPARFVRRLPGMEAG